MVAGQQARRLLLLLAQASADVILIVKLRYIPGLVVEIAHLEKQLVLDRDLLLEPRRQTKLFQIIVRPETALGAIRGVQRITRIAHHAELRTVLAPITVAGVFRAGENSQAIGGKQFRILLLRDVLRQ